MSQSATVTATFSRRMHLQLADGSTVAARIKGKRLRPVCGDRVLAEKIENEADWLINEILERDNELSRPNMRGKVEILAANVDLLVVTAAVSPKPDWFIVDRYLCAAEIMRAEAAVVFNKIDLLENHQDVDLALADYEAIDYATVRCSATSGDGISELQALLAGKTSIIVGQSGVGKSSIINQMIEGDRQRTSAVSDKSGEGRHTTVNSSMLELPGGGAIIDSPGVRDYAPALQSAVEAEHGFREIHDLSHHCRFNNCRHMQEPGCAVKGALEAGTVSARRYESYRRTLILTEQLNKQQ